MEEQAFRRLPPKLSRAHVHKFPSMLEYKSPTTLDMPRGRDLSSSRSPTPNGPFGAKEVGQGPLLPIMPAVANAVFDAVGVRIDEVPITPEKILKALGATTQRASARRRFPTIAWPEPLQVPPPWEGGDGKATNEPPRKRDRNARAPSEPGGSGHDAAAALSVFRAAHARATRPQLLADTGPRGAGGRRRHRSLAEHEAAPADAAPRDRAARHRRRCTASRATAERRLHHRRDDLAHRRRARSRARRRAGPRWPSAAAWSRRRRLRNMGTLGGNLCLDTRCNYYEPVVRVAQGDRLLHEEGRRRSAGSRRAATRCWAVSSSDTAPVLCAIGAEVTLVRSTASGGIAVARAVPRRRDRISRQASERDPDRDPRACATTGAGARPTGSCGGASRSTSRCSASRRRRASTAASCKRRASSSPAPARGRTTRQRRRRCSWASASTIATRSLPSPSWPRALAKPLDNTDFALGWRKEMAHTYVAAALTDLA